MTPQEAYTQLKSRYPEERICAAQFTRDDKWSGTITDRAMVEVGDRDFHAPTLELAIAKVRLPAGSEKAAELRAAAHKLLDEAERLCPA